MLHKLKNRKSEGFTIIEVLIVLAIAGLILLIVFLAVPNLQRSSRNTQRKTDIGRVGSAATTVVSNGGGQMASLVSGTLQTEIGTNLSYYTTTNVTATVLASGTSTNTTTTDTAVVVGNGACGTGANAANAVFSQRQIAVLYSSEGGGGAPTRLCVDQ